MLYCALGFLTWHLYAKPNLEGDESDVGQDLPNFPILK